jgi:hypothetical protein
VALDEAFNGAWWKWLWGVVHAKRLQEDCQRWGLNPDNKPFFEMRSRYNPKRHGFEVTVHNLRPLPIEWGLAVVDIGHNWRSALDHVAWTLVERGTRPPSTLTEPQRRRVMFPVQEHPPGTGGFTAIAARRLPGIGREYRAIVRRQQPYMRGKRRAPRHPLTLLTAINNGDKHRTIQPVAAIPTDAELQITELRDCEVTRIPSRRHAQPLDEGAELAVIRVRRTGPEPHMEVNGNVPSIPTVGDLLTLEQWLNHIAFAVAAVLEEFSEIPADIAARIPT